MQIQGGCYSYHLEGSFLWSAEFDAFIYESVEVALADVGGNFGPKLSGDDRALHWSTLKEFQQINSKLHHRLWNNMQKLWRDMRAGFPHIPIQQIQGLSRPNSLNASDPTLCGLRHGSKLINLTTLRILTMRTDKLLYRQFFLGRISKSHGKPLKHKSRMKTALIDSNRRWRPPTPSW